MASAFADLSDCAQQGKHSCYQVGDTDLIHYSQNGMGTANVFMALAPVDKQAYDTYSTKYSSVGDYYNEIWDWSNDGTNTFVKNKEKEVNWHTNLFSFVGTLQDTDFKKSNQTYVDAYNALKKEADHFYMNLTFPAKAVCVDAAVNCTIAHFQKVPEVNLIQ